MHVYQEAYGFTRLRLLVDVFEGWLGLLVLAVLGAGAAAPRRLAAPRRAAQRGRRPARRWPLSTRTPGSPGTTSTGTPRPARSTGPTCGGLSADAVPGARRPARRCGECALGATPGDDDWLEWNLGRQRAEPLMRSHLANWEYSDAVCAGEAAD